MLNSEVFGSTKMPKMSKNFILVFALIKVLNIKYNMQFKEDN
jgi:hypothetical protein